MSDNVEFNRGFQEGLKFAERNHIPASSLNESFDKFLDKINYLKGLLKESYDAMLPLAMQKEHIDLGFVLQKIKKEIGA
jgi:hypothetical protein